MLEMGRYGAEARGLAEEIDELLEREDKTYLAEVRRKIGDSELVRLGIAFASDALDFLARPPSRRAAVLKRHKREEEKIMLIATARSLAYAAVAQIDRAESVSYLKGSGYREATSKAAAIALDAPPAISADLMVPAYW